MTQSMATTVDRGGIRNVIWSKCAKSISTTFREVKCLFLILKHPDTPWRVRIILFFPVAYICSPIQLFPNFIPVFGQLDDLFAIWIANQLVLRFVSEKIRLECTEKAGATKLVDEGTTLICEGAERANDSRLRRTSRVLYGG
jgi:uncharacterized membrane protein YkvA (DUF1232 family)